MLLLSRHAGLQPPARHSKFDCQAPSLQGWVATTHHALPVAAMALSCCKGPLASMPGRRTRPVQLNAVHATCPASLARFAMLCPVLRPAPPHPAPPRPAPPCPALPCPALPCPALPNVSMLTLTGLQARHADLGHHPVKASLAWLVQLLPGLSHPAAGQTCCIWWRQRPRAKSRVALHRQRRSPRLQVLQCAQGQKWDHSPELRCTGIISVCRRTGAVFRRIAGCGPVAPGFQFILHGQSPAASRTPAADAVACLLHATAHCQHRFRGRGGMVHAHLHVCQDSRSGGNPQLLPTPSGSAGHCSLSYHQARSCCACVLPILAQARTSHQKLAGFQ